MNINPQRAQALFAAAVKLPDAAAQRAFLDQECAGDGALRQRVEELLAAYPAASGVGNKPADGSYAPTIDEPRIAQSGLVVGGRYKLLEAIGEGGMGTVWVAEQSQPVKRKVAVKLVKAGMDSRQMLARFDAERQALAMMDHPNIAKVLDGGLTDQGRPYFAMEYVKGIPLTAYCDEARLSLKERLNLFIPVCQAVQHAHQKGIIHRDLKPSNILVCLYDGKPTPKVIDFGLAKAMHHSLTDQTLHTAHGVMVGTPLYMSPEQAEYNNLDVDTRTDVYSLGVILYELLTGTTPLEKQQLKQAAFNEVLRLIKDVEPPKPSTRLSSSANLQSIAAQRRLDPRQLRKTVAGDLDWIVMKALEKERSRRYETANGLARDVERYLHEEPVEACPPSTMYRFRKFVQKHRAAFVTAAAFVLLLVSATAFSTWQAFRAAAATVAEKEQRERAGRAEKEALGNEAKAKVNEAKAKENETKAKKGEAAEALAKEAERKQKELARAAQIQAEDRLASNYVANGQRHSQEGDLLTSQIWFAQALKLESKDADRDSVHRIRLGSYLRSCPTLSLACSFERPVANAKFSSDGKLVATLSNYVRVWDAKTGEPRSPKLIHKAFDAGNLDFSADGRLLTASGTNLDQSRRVWIWKADDGELAIPPLEMKSDVQHSMFSPDTHSLLVATGPGRNSNGESAIHLIEIATGQDSFPPIKIPGSLAQVRFSPDGETIVVVQQRSPAEVSLWNAKTGKLRQQPFILGDGSVEAEFAAISPHGLRLVTTGNANVKHPSQQSYHRVGIARVWDCSTNVPITLEMQHRRSVTFAAFSPNDRLVATATGGNMDGVGVYEAWIWDARTGLPVVPPLLHSAAISLVQFSPRGEALLTASLDGTVRIWDVVTGGPLTPPLHGQHAVRDASFSPDGTRVLMACGERYLGSGEMRIWDWNVTPKPDSFEMPSGQVHFSPDGSRAVSIPGSTVYSDPKPNRAHLLALQKGGEPVPVLHNGHAYSASFSWDNRLLAVGSGQTPTFRSSAPTPAQIGGEVQVFDAKTAEPVSSPLKHPSPVVFAEFSPDSRLLFTVSQERYARSSFFLWDLTTQKQVFTREDPSSWFSDARFSPDGKRLIIADLSSFLIINVDSKASAPAKVWFRGGSGGGHDGAKRRIAFAPDGKKAILCSGGDDALLLDVEKAEQVGPRIAGRSVDHVAFSPDGKTVLTAGEKEVRLWHADTGKASSPPLTHAALVAYAEFALDGRIVLTASQDYTVRIWDSRTGEQVTTPFMHSSFVQQARVAAHGNRLLSQVHSRIYSWDLSPITWPQEDLVSWVEFVGCRQINDQGHLIATRPAPATPLLAFLSGDGPNATWKKFRTGYPVLFERSDPPRIDPVKESAVTEETAHRLETKGREAFDQGRISDALASFQALNSICEQLVKSNPTNRGMKGRLWISYYWLGRANIALNRDLPAESSLRKAAELCQALRDSDPADLKALADLAYPHWAMSEWKESQGDFNAAREKLQSLLKILEPGLEGVDKEGRVHQAHVTTLTLLRTLYIKQGNMEGARSTNLQTLQAQERRAKKEPKDYAVRLVLASGRLELAREAFNFGKTDDAKGEAEVAVQWLEECRATEDPDLAFRVASGFRSVGLMAVELKDTALASKSYESGLELQKTGLEKRPTGEGCYNLACYYGLRASVVPESELPKFATLAVAELKKAGELGYQQQSQIENDPDLDAIRTQPGYKLFIESLQRKRQ